MGTAQAGVMSHEPSSRWAGRRLPWDHACEAPKVTSCYTLHIKAGVRSEVLAVCTKSNLTTVL